MLHLGSAHDNVLKGSDLSDNPLRRKWNKNNSKIKKKTAALSFLNDLSAASSGF